MLFRSAKRIASRTQIRMERSVSKRRQQLSAIPRGVRIRSRIDMGIWMPRINAETSLQRAGNGCQIGLAVKIPSGQRWFTPINVCVAMRLTAQIVTRIGSQAAKVMESREGNALGNWLGNRIGDRAAMRIGMDLGEWIRTWITMGYNNRIIIRCAW